ncbi:MAG: four-carbon acid sugar kinase family protein [Verrucomicrobiota bacterium]
MHSNCKPVAGIIADDLTGAAEVAGVAWHCNLSAEVHTGIEAAFSADVVSLDTDSRELSVTEAVRRVTKASRRLRGHQADLIYKKVDSVLRGSVLQELKAVQAVFKFERVLLVPSNPGMGRVIKRGCYYIGGKLIHKSDFHHDPNHPCHFSRVIELLGANGTQTLSLRRPNQSLPARGIIIGQAASKEDLQTWAARLDKTILPAGAAEFFAAILEAKGYARNTHPFLCAPKQSDEDITLFVCGSASESARKFLTNCRRRGLPVMAIPNQLMAPESATDAYRHKWAKATVRAFRHNRCVIVSINKPVMDGALMSKWLRDQLVAAVISVMKKVQVNRLCIEGGSTAAALLHSLGWQKMTAVHEFSPGIVAMRSPKGASITAIIKPGSYAWPDELTNQICSRR